MTTNGRTTYTRRPRAFTLIEMVIVLGIIGLILGAAVGLGGKILEHGRVKTTEARLVTLRTNLTTYNSICGVYPTEEQGLAALVEKPTRRPVPRSWEPVLVALPEDAWQRPYQYRYPGSVVRSEPEVISAGSDGEFGTDDDLSSQPRR